MSVLKEERDTHILRIAEFSLWHTCLTATSHGNSAVKNEQKKEERISLHLDSAHCAPGLEHPSSVNLPVRQGDNCSNIQLKSLRVLKEKINFVTMQSTYSNVSGTEIQRENQLPASEVWGRAGTTPQRQYLHEEAGERSTRP